MSQNTAPLQGLRVIDFTNVQSGPSCTQMLAWFGAEVIKIERPGVGDATRTELQFDPSLPSYYYLQLNSDKKSVELNAATPDGKAILTKMLENADIFVENLHPGAMCKLGFSWENVHKINPKIIYATIKGFPEGSPYAGNKAYEPVAQVAAGAAATTGWYEGEYNIPTQSGAALGDSNTGMHLLIGILAAVIQRQKTGEGCYVYQSMYNACLNLCRIKTRDQQTLDKIGYLTQYPQYPDGKFNGEVPRAGNIEAGGVIGWCYKCKNWKTDSNDYVYIVVERTPSAFKTFCEVMGFQDWLTNPDFSTPDARDRNKKRVWERIQSWCIDKTKYEVNDLLKDHIPVAPVLSIREIMEMPSNYENKSLVKINQGGKIGEFVTVGCPCTFSNFTPKYGPAPSLGENTVEVLTALGYSKEDLQRFNANGTTAKSSGPCCCKKQSSATK